VQSGCWCGYWLHTSFLGLLFDGAFSHSYGRTSREDTRVLGLVLVLHLTPYIFSIAEANRRAEGLVKATECRAAGGAQRRALTSPEHSVDWEREKCKVLLLLLFLLLSFGSHVILLFLSHSSSNSKNARKSKSSSGLSGPSVIGRFSASGSSGLASPWGSSNWGQVAN
jgi:hypothetical protein